MPPKDLDQYIWWLMDQKPELKSTPTDIKEELHDQLAERMDTVINAAILAAMPPAALPEFDAVLQKGDQTTIQAFCQDKIPNMDEVVAGALLKFRDDYLGES